MFQIHRVPGLVAGSSPVAEAFVAAARADRSQTLIALDVDGTVSEIAPSPKEAFVDREARSLLRALSHAYQLWFISGRDAEQSARMVNIPNARYIGDHGLEVLTDDGVRPLASHPAVGDVLDRMAGAVIADVPEVAPYVERKRYGVAFHYRTITAPTVPERLRESIAAHLRPGLRLLSGKMVLEVIADRTHDKGTALRWLIGSTHVRRVLAAGDDETDLPMFRLLARQPARIGSLRVAVLQGKETPDSLVETSDVAVNGVAGLCQLLQELR